MYPLTLIRLSRKRKIALTLADERTVTGYLAKCDVAMNLHLQNATITCPDGVSSFAKEVYLRGQNIKFVKIDHRIMERQHLFD